MSNTYVISESTIAKITQERRIESDFDSLTCAFEAKLEAFNPIEHAFALNAYFTPGIGVKGVLKALARDFPHLHQAASEGKPDGLLTDFMGLYVLIHDDRPFYVGISRKVVNRLNQHLKGHSHFSASLAYKIARINEGDHSVSGDRKSQRKELEAEKIKAAQVFLLAQRAAILPFNNHDELYLFEVFLSMKYKTCLNTFETH
jgi:hypothetical protein